MNKGIRLSKGDIIGMINSDDWYEPAAVERAAETYTNTDYDMMFADIRIHSKAKSYLKRAKISRWVTSRTWNHPTTFTRREIYRQNMFPCQSMYDDFNLYVKLRKEKKHFVALNEALANYRMGGMSNKKSLRAAWNRMKTRYAIYRRNGYSRIYMLECLFIEGVKYVLS
jgi:glycosyltransferase involved in cell wall biosynthesis